LLAISLVAPIGSAVIGLKGELNTWHLIKRMQLSGKPVYGELYDNQQPLHAIGDFLGGSACRHHSGAAPQVKAAAAASGPWWTIRSRQSGS
jgi:hypothetical protein